MPPRCFGTREKKNKEVAAKLGLVGLLQWRTPFGLPDCMSVKGLILLLKVL